MHNDFSVLCIALDLTADFPDAVANVKKKTNAIKNSLFPYGAQTLALFLASLPATLGYLLNNLLISKASRQAVAFSNLPGPISPFVFNKKLRSRKIIGVLPCQEGL